jgi:phage shock protein E
MSSRRLNQRGHRGGSPAGRPSTAERGGTGGGATPSTRTWALVGSGLLIAFVGLLVGWALLSNQSNAGTSTAREPAGTVVQANGGHWTNISPDTLAAMLEHKDFTLLNVKAPYMGEIAGTDLYIPYSDVALRARELPQDRGARIVVYCRSGRESAEAAQALINLGYTNIDNLDGGMTAWTSSGRGLVQLARPSGAIHSRVAVRPVTVRPISRAA